MSDLLVETRDRIRWLTLNRPHRLNALTWSLRDELLTALGEAATEDLDAVVLTGAGRGFCAGIDLSVLDEDAGNPVAVRRADLERAQEIVALMRRSPCPMVAAVNGVAAGGGWGLALGAHVVVAAASARFVTAFVQLGLVPDLGFGVNLTRRVGTLQAKSIIMRGRRLDAAEALAIGAVDRVVPDGELADAVADVVAAAAARPA